MKRTNPAKGRGVDPKFVPITWDEALDTLADRLIALRKNDEAHKFCYNPRPLLVDVDRTALLRALPRI